MNPWACDHQFVTNNTVCWTKHKIDQNKSSKQVAFELIQPLSIKSKANRFFATILTNFDEIWRIEKRINQTNFTRTKFAALYSRPFFYHWMQFSNGKHPLIPTDFDTTIFHCVCTVIFPANFPPLLNQRICLHFIDHSHSSLK